ncbi:hypothetical protein N7509_006055 [Penicillium cosmopolitanum]|uniref:Nucleotide-diphospho-sugar transferase domain-containing protein n=1 Tax=Penicillium cosmopolitanum TaxID=1131564 RepID=A0A9W9W3M0_9EURO|nr:uncharacterized protein N7509_006055 [Penicillium cosmopolitanum]KAJ5397942.1 hypothetical protein N7509_006055 [Penicillium cosmopolitanum]
MIAQLHGYDYKFMQMPTFSGMHGTWSKVSAVREHLYLYDFVVFMDADTIFPHPHVPLEWLFNYWDIVPDNLIAMALDPQDPINNDLRGRTLLNTGFIVAQQSPRAHELFTAWESCPQEMKYPGCSNFSYSWPHEQGAFGNFLRYDFNRPDDVNSLKCAESNGCPEVAHTGCLGKLVRHYWGSKASVPSAVQESIVQYFLSSLHEEFHHDYANIVYTTYGNPNFSPAGDGNFTPDISQEIGSEIPGLTQEDFRETIETSPILNP